MWLNFNAVILSVLFEGRKDQYLISKETEIVQYCNYLNSLEMSSLPWWCFLFIIKYGWKDVLKQARSMHITKLFHVIRIIQMLSPICIVLDQGLVELLHKNAICGVSLSSEKYLLQEPYCGFPCFFLKKRIVFAVFLWELL